MAEFFRGWKRKVGASTLVFSCLFGGLWLRSQRLNDILSFGPEAFDVKVASTPNVLALQLLPDGDAASLWSGWEWPRWKSFRSDPANPHGIEIEITPALFDWLIPRWDTGQVIGYYLYIPYRNIVIPLTLISAWLLLSKPRQAQKPPTNGAASE